MSEVERAAPGTGAPAIWEKCPRCGEINYRKLLERRLFVCPRCGHHLRLTLEQRLLVTADRGSFRERDAEVGAADPLGFRDRRSYAERLAAVRRETGRKEAVVTGTARIGGHAVALGVFDFAFLGGSMGSGVGERLTRLIEHAAAKRLPLVVVSASGGARMQEGIFSLLQMAKIGAALARLRARKVPFISLMTDPTTGGVAASLALLGDVNLAEPGALIGFAGPRVIEQTIHQKLPEGFQRAEFLLEHGMLDAIVPRAELRATLARLLDLLAGPRVAPRRRRPRRAR
ncbi:MAG TPA: acetyl-CoA carboxylase, carboxyltransferase subunit beta [Verrucomicrobiae bacterium]|nr:acetyl-CoA carboxylase, carboxyltransferase subunit beta [Verrucomicrobiae bacterium]